MEKPHLVVPRKEGQEVRGLDRRGVAKPEVPKENPYKVDSWTFGILVRKGSFWVGVHHSPTEKRFCINLIPCVTIFVVQPGGNRPRPYSKWE